MTILDKETGEFTENAMRVQYWFCLVFGLILTTFACVYRCFQ